jgi:uncharacterized phiE125 gp8 family phage protein
MGVHIHYSDSHLDYFTRNLIATKDDQVATAHGYVSAVRTIDAEVEPVELDEAKVHLNFDLNEHDQDGAVDRWLKAARQRVEKDTGLALLPQTWRATVEQFPSYRQSLYLPVYPVQSISSFTYVDRDGAETDLVVSPDNFILSSTGRPAQLGLIDTATWPTDARKFHPGTLEFVAGWPTPNDVPNEIVMAILKLIGDFAGFRESKLVGQLGTAPQTYDELIAPWVLPVIA